MPGGIHVLCVDADPDSRASTAAALERRRADIDVTTAKSGRKGLAVFDAESDAEPDRTVDCVVSDYELPGVDGLELLAAVRERDPTVPFILFPSNGSEAIASEAISAGVTDYLRTGSETDQYAVLANRVEDAVEKRRAERARREGERELARHERLIELVPTALFVLDADATIGWSNEEFADAFAEDRADLIGTPFPKLVERGYYDERVTTKYTEEVRGLLSSSVDRERAKYQVRFHAPDGEERIHDVHTRLLPLEDGEFTGTIHAIRDITRRRRYRRELERQNERLAEFTSLVSHDLRNPLNVAQGNLDMLAEQLDSPRVDELQWSLARMEELIDGLLQLARQGKTIGDETWLSLASAAREAWSTVDTGDARLEIATDIEIYGDETRVRELLENLFRNAVEHGSTSPDSQTHQDAVEHGSASPLSRAQQDAAERDPTAAERCHGEETDRLLVTVGALESDSRSTDEGTRPHGFYVEDTGSGLPADHESLFEFGYTTETDGTGLGLAIVEGIVTAHGWSIAARNGSSGGARFEIDGVRVAANATDTPVADETDGSD
ncbi:response regulator [Natrinema sp. LN54]|uniref:response regulator n=1 Tax=Natrinema sp. LN54 TaxID=3458705 RepID=UPI004037226C